MDSNERLGHPALKRRRGAGQAADEGVMRALIAGGIAAIVGGGIWAGVVTLTNFEVGWVAWGVGFLVGLAMAAATPSRGQAMGVLAVLLAAVGLVVGKALIIYFAMQPTALAAEIRSDEEWMAHAAAYDLNQRNAFPQPIQSRIDALSINDTLPDALWEDMLAAGAEHAANAEAEEHDWIAASYAQTLMSSVPFSEQLFASLSAWDLLWFGLAITTAWKMMAAKQEEPAVIVEDAAEPEVPVG